MPLLDLDLIEAAAKPDHNAFDTAVAHDQVRAEPNHRNGDIARKTSQQIGEIACVLRHDQNLRRTADAKPGELGQRLVREQAAAQFAAAWISNRGRCRGGSFDYAVLPPLRVTAAVRARDYDDLVVSRNVEQSLGKVP